MEPPEVSQERDKGCWLDVHGHGGRKKPLIEMRESIDQQHRRIGDSLHEVHRLLGEAAVVREDLAPSERPLQTLSWLLALPLAFAFVPVALFLWLRESVHPTAQPARLGAAMPPAALPAGAPSSRRLRTGRRSV